MKQIYWIIDGDDRTWHHKDRLKQFGCKWDKDHKAWTIENPTDTFKKWVEAMGLQIQWRKDEV